MTSLIRFERLDRQLGFQTQGLQAIGRMEIEVIVNDPSLLGESEEYLRFVAEYLLTSGTELTAGETMAYGYWLVKFVATDRGTLETWEYGPGADKFMRGANLTLRYWREQHSICQAQGSDFVPPRPDKITVISGGVMEGLPVQAVRYPSPDHMSGWWITTDDYDGNPDTLRREHTYHLTAARPDLAKYLALPYGYRFDLSSTEDVWLDRQLLLD